MLALETMGVDAQAFFYVVAFFAFTIGAVMAWLTKQWIIALVATGLALSTLVGAWNAVAAT